MKEKNMNINKTALKNILVFILVLGLSSVTADAKKSYSARKNTKTQVVKPSQGVISAKNKAFKNIKYTLPLLSYKTELTDRNYDVNMHYMEQQINQSADETRMLFPYLLGNMLISYGVKYSDKPNEIYHYNSEGKLMRIEISDNTEKYPRRTLTYNNKGKLNTVVLYVSQTEQYNFDGAGNLIVHWIGERGFNKYGKLLKVRRTI